MAVRKSKEENERLTEARIAEAILKLEPSDPAVKPASKKDICAFLGISYNTTRLDSIIKEHKEKIATDKAMRAEKRGKPATDVEIEFCLNSYLLEYMPISSIAAALYRSTNFVNLVLEQAGVTFRSATHDYFNPTLISDADARDRFDIGEVVYNARYNTNCIIKAESYDPKYGYVYKVWLLGDHPQFAFTAAYDLGSLSILKKANGN